MTPRDDPGPGAGRLHDKIAIVTGAGAGIGRAVARAAVAEGARVSLFDIDGEAAAKVAGAFSSGTAVSFQVDVSRAEEIDRAVTSTVETFGRVDALFNIAGIADELIPTEELEEALWNRVFEINVHGTMLVTKRVLREMLAAGSGAIVNAASAASVTAGGGGAAYVASKSAVAGFTRQVAYEVADRGVRVNAIAPGATATDLLVNSAKTLGVAAGDLGPQAKRFKKRLLARLASDGAIPVGRVATPEEVAKAAVFLASDDATYIVGASLAVDGGLSTTL